MRENTTIPFEPPFGPGGEQDCVSVYALPMLPPSEESGISLYVSIYDAIYRMIESGEAKEGQLLPGENVLAAYWGVSRGTVRQALQHLEEDGLIHKTRGRGTIVAAQVHKQLNGLQWCSNPCMDYCTEPIDRVELNWSFEGAGHWMTETFTLPRGALLLIANLQYYCGKALCACARYLLPASMLERFQVDAADEASIRKFLLDTLCQQASRSQTSLFVLPGPKEDEFPMVCDVPLLFMEELLFDAQDKPTAFCKHYLRSDCYRLTLTRRQRGGL